MQGRCHRCQPQPVPTPKKCWSAQTTSLLFPHHAEAAQAEAASYEQEQHSWAAVQEVELVFVPKIALEAEVEAEAHTPTTSFHYWTVGP